MSKNIEITARQREALARKHDLMRLLKDEGLDFRSIIQGPTSTKVDFPDSDDAKMGIYILEEEGYSVEPSGSRTLMVAHENKQKRSSVMNKVDVARSLVALAKSIEAEGEVDMVDELDEKFVSKLRLLRTQLSKISQKKRRKLGQLGIGVLRQTATVEDLVDALLVAASA